MMCWTVSLRFIQRAFSWLWHFHGQTKSVLSARCLSAVRRKIDEFLAMLGEKRRNMLDNYHSRSMKVTRAATKRCTYIHWNYRPSTRHLKELLHGGGRALVPLLNEVTLNNKLLVQTTKAPLQSIVRS